MHQGLSRRFVAFIYPLTFLLFSPAIAQDGEALFKQFCTQCHSVGKGKVIGPDLRDVASRAPGEDWLVKWIINSQDLIKAGDAYAVKIYEANNKTEMPAQPVTADEAKAILAYIAAVKVDDPATAVSGVNPCAPAPEENAGNTTLFILALIAGFLIIMVNALYSVRRSLKNIVNTKEGLPAEPDVNIVGWTWQWLGRNKRITALIVIVFLMYGSKAAWDGMMSIGVYEGYAPPQPIAFPHDLHAGKNGIDCVYCHSGAEKGKTAGIPSLNVCMNCHRGVTSGSRTGSAEIAKIYDYLDYDPETGTYGDNPKPVQWVRVHNLPDLAYFNHSQHVKVAGLQCQECHGPVEEMCVLKQFAPLTMGWCLDCHRTREVKGAGSAYYDELHARMSEESKQKFMKDGKITVSELGGMECAKCHY